MMQCIEEGMPEGTVEEKLLNVFDALSKRADEKKMLSVVSALVDRTQVKEKDIETLEAILEEKRSQLRKKKKK
jgi:predicted transcriptional regulator